MEYFKGCMNISHNYEHVFTTEPTARNIIALAAIGIEVIPGEIFVHVDTSTYLTNWSVETPGELADWPYQWPVRVVGLYEEAAKSEFNIVYGNSEYDVMVDQDNSWYSTNPFEIELREQFDKYKG